MGVLCGLGYLVYNGYWSVGAAILILAVGWRTDGWRARVRQGLLALAGLLLPIAIVFGVARIGGYDLIAHSLRFADTVNQGDFGEGWRFVPEYLVTTDGALPIALIGFVAVGALAAFQRRAWQPWLRWVGVIILLAAIWIFFSDVRPKFVLYGRTVRAAVPFLALAAAGAVAFLCAGAGKTLRRLIVLIALASIPGHRFLDQPNAVFLGRDYFGTKGVRSRFAGKILELRIESSANP